MDGPDGRLLRRTKSCVDCQFELPKPAFSKLEALARACRRTVAHLVEEVITSLADAFALPEEGMMRKGNPDPRK